MLIETSSTNTPPIHGIVHPSTVKNEVVLQKLATYIPVCINVHKLNVTINLLLTVIYSSKST